MTERSEIICCELGIGHIHWSEAEEVCGPNVDGWVMYLYIGGFVYKPNIYFCPFCGESLYKEESCQRNQESTLTKK